MTDNQERKAEARGATAQGKKNTRGKKIKIVVVSGSDLLEPHTLQRFQRGVEVVLDEMTPWVAAQIKAGLMREL